jgi:hypothetical protein
MTGDSAMTQGRRADSARRRQRVIKAINDATGSGGELSVSAIARAAGVDRTFLYRHPDLLAQVHLAQERPAVAENGGPAASRASLQADLANAQGQIGRQAVRIRQLEGKLSQTLGEQAWRESGLGAPEDIDKLKRRITELEQEVVDLTRQLEVASLVRDSGQEVTDWQVRHLDPVEGTDGTYIIDVTVRFRLLGADYLTLFECKRHATPVKREHVQVLHDKLRSTGPSVSGSGETPGVTVTGGT